MGGLGTCIALYTKQRLAANAAAERKAIAEAGPPLSKAVDAGGVVLKRTVELSKLARDAAVPEIQKGLQAGAQMAEKKHTQLVTASTKHLAVAMGSVTGRYRRFRRNSIGAACGLLLAYGIGRSLPATVLRGLDRPHPVEEQHGSAAAGAAATDARDRGGRAPAGGSALLTALDPRCASPIVAAMPCVLACVLACVEVKSSH
jgi:hypothetical protein